MPARTRFVSMVGVCLLAMSLVIALGLRSRTLAQRKVTVAQITEKVEPSRKIAEAQPDLTPLDASAPASESKAESITTIPTIEDPEKAAQLFVDRTRKEADSAIKSLSAEAETLRERLKKVEAGLKRWQTLQAALGQDAQRVGEGKDAGIPADGLKSTAHVEVGEPNLGAAALPPLPTNVVPTSPEPIPADVPKASAEPVQKK